MKKLLAVAAGLAVLGTAGIASAVSFSSTSSISELLFGTGTEAWQQSMPGDFEIPYDTVNSATLTIYANFVGGSNDGVIVESTYVGTLTNDTGWTWLWNPIESSVFNISSSFGSSWPTGQALDVTLAYNESWCLDPIYLSRSVLNIDYSNGAAAVPEPGTLFLLGSGLLGLVAVGRKRK